jgi:hypothetical protein
MQGTHAQIRAVGRLAVVPALGTAAAAGRGPEMDGPELVARDLALLATTDPEAFWSALHELHDALATAAHPDAALLALGAELHALAEAVHAGPPDAALDEADARLATVEGLIAAAAPRTGAGLAVKLRLAWLWWVEDGIESRHGPNDGSDERTRLLWRLIAEAEALDGARAECTR